MKRPLLILLTVHYSLFTIICSLFTIHCSARRSGQPLIDSLLTELPKQKEDTNKVNMLNALSWNYQEVNPDAGIKYGQQGLDLATKLAWKKGMAAANNRLGLNYVAKSDYSKVLPYYTTALKISEEIGDKRGVATVTGNVGNVYSDQGDYPRALEYDFKALKMHEEIGDKAGVARVAGNIGNVYISQSDFSRALEYDFKALKMHKEIGDKAGVARVTGNIGNAYSAQNDYSRALEYDFKALEMNEELGNKNVAAINTGNIGTVYFALKNYSAAIAFGKKALGMDEEIGSKRPAAYALRDIGTAYLALAEDSVQGNKAAIPADLPAGIAVAAPAIPSGKAARLRIAICYLQRGLDSAKKINVLAVEKGCFEDLAEAYRTKGDFKKAMEYNDSYTAIKDAMFSQENARKTKNLEMQQQEEADSMKTAHAQRLADIKYHHQRNYTYLGIAATLLLIAFSFFIVKERGKSEKERKRSDGLLLNILPGEVAEELKNKGSSAARQFDNVTVLFTDFVGFTKAGERMSPQALVEELNTCFKAFDEITARHNIEKIKTIGDAYLAVAGLPLADPFHAEHMVSAAIEIRDFMAARHERLGDRTFEIRIGIHSGDVVAGIIGVKKFAYDIWGDTVNTAARMEQNSEPGKINISEATYDLVKDKFTCEYRGEIDAKNKGMMKMYFASSPIAFSA